MMRRIATLALALASLASPLAAQSPPDLSGKWTLDAKASEGPMMPSSMTLVIAQDSKTVKMDNTSTMAMGEQKMESKSSLTFNLDGSPTKNTLSNMGQSLDLISTSKWDGSALVISTQADLGAGRTMTQTDRWVLSPDGKTLKLTRDVVAGGQSMAVRMSFVKQ